MTDPKTAQQKALDQLHSGVAQLLTSSGWLKALQFRAQFHAYSFLNTLLILSQYPTASLVAGYRKWQQLGRQVQRGQKGITILAPLIRKDKDDPDKQVVFGFRNVSVFDITQTAGEPIPQPPQPRALTGDSEAIRQTITALELYCQDAGINLNWNLDHPRALGVFIHDDNTISLKPRLPALQALKTLVHELGHALLHDPSVDRMKAELEAETTAFLTLHHFGLDTSEYSFSYLAGWTDSLDSLIAAGDNASKASMELVRHITQHLNSNPSTTVLAAPQPHQAGTPNAPSFMDRSSS